MISGDDAAPRPGSRGADASNNGSGSVRGIRGARRSHERAADPATPDRLRGLALRLNARGIRAFPVELIPDGHGGVRKKPLVTGYFGDRPYPDKAVRSMPWSNAEAVGWAQPGGNVVLDIDTKKGKQGEVHLAELERVHGPLPPTMTQPTPSGGRHLVYRLPAPVSTLNSRCRLPDGSPADIDIVHCRYRFLTVYDETMFDQPIAELPASWREAIVPHTRSPQRAPDRPASDRSDMGELVASIGRAEEGSRNDTLNRAVFTLAMHSRWDHQTHLAVKSAAEDAGLSGPETDATIDSALAAADRRRSGPSAWLAQVRNDPRLASRRSRATLLAAAQVLCDLQVLHGDGFGLSVRELGERIGQSHVTASKRLTDLEELGHLKRHRSAERGIASTFELVDVTSVNSPPPNDGGLLRDRTSADAARLMGHSAFIRLGGRTSLPKSCAAVLAALVHGTDTVQAIAAATGLKEPTVRRNLHVLQSAGLLTYDSRTTRTARLVEDDVEKALDHWTAWTGTADNAELLKDRHRVQRAAYARWGSSPPRSDGKRNGIQGGAKKKASPGESRTPSPPRTGTARASPTRQPCRLTHPRPPTHKERRMRTPDVPELHLYPCQHDALRDWRANRCRGIVEAVTGTGKTRLAIAAIGDNCAAGSQSVVLVPTCALQDQWVGAIKALLPQVRVGRWGHGHHDRMDDCDVVVAVVDSALKHLPEMRHIDLLVADECHKYGAEKHRAALVRVPHRLGLTATLELSDEGAEQVLLPYFGKVVHRIGYERARADGIVSPFTVDLIGVDFAEAFGRTEYERLTWLMEDCREALVSGYGYPRHSGEFLARVTAKNPQRQSREADLCGQYTQAFVASRGLLASDPAKVRALAGLAPDILASGRCLVFTEVTSAAVEGAQALRAKGVHAAAIHSKLNARERRRMLMDFEQGLLHALLAPRILDDGVDFPDADLGIIVAASRTRRQMIQRLGRILRPKPDGRSSRFVILHMIGTSEDPSHGTHAAFLDEVLP